MAPTTLISKVPVTEAPQPPVGAVLTPSIVPELRVFQAAYTRLACGVPGGATKMSEGPPESAHWRSDQACEAGSVIGTGGPKVAPPSVEVSTNMLCETVPETRSWKSR